MFVWEEVNPYCTAMLYGKLLAPQNTPQVDQSILFGTQPTKYQTSIMRMPKEVSAKYHCCLHDNTSNAFFDSDAVLLSAPRQSVAFATSDCGATILYSKDTKDVVLAHTGRNQLMDATRPTKRVSILEACISALCSRGATRTSIHTLSVSQIAATHFTHKGHQDEALVRAQATLWGKDIMPDRELITLNLVQLITAQLVYYGVPYNNILPVRINPYTSPDLFSKRAGKLGSNVIMLARPDHTNDKS